MVVAAENSEATEQVVKQAFKSMPARVFFHISTEAQRSRAKNIARQLENELSGLNLIVPGIERKAGPNTTELRIFKEAEKIGSGTSSTGGSNENRLANNHSINDCINLGGLQDRSENRTG